MMPVPRPASEPQPLPKASRPRATLVLPWDLDPRMAAFPRTPEEGWLLVVETRAKPKALPWHRQKLLMVLSALRHFVAERREAGFHVVHVVGEDYASAVREVHRWARPERMAAHRPREWALDQRFQALAREGLLELLEDGGPGGHFVATREDFETFALSRSRWLQEEWYRRMRRHTGLLMRGKEPEGGRWNFDAENRSHARGAEVPPPAWFEPDDLTRSLMPWAQRTGRFGRLDPFGWPVTRREALQWLEAFANGALADFGPFEDALRQDARVLFHSRLSAPLNLGLLHPLECCEAAERAYARGKVSLASAEGFIRQILGWREFIRGAYWHLMPGLREANGLEHHRPLPAAFWDPDATDLACLKEAVASVRDLGWTHHIARLMVLCNFASLVEADPRAVSHWFWAAFVDAFEWVELPNVLGMGLFATDAFTTKPYVASAAYLKRQMGLPAKGLGRGAPGRTACEGCRYDPDRRTGEGACPFNALYWRFLHRHRPLFERNPRTRAVLDHLDRMGPEALAAVLETAESFLAGLAPADPAWTQNLDEDAG